MTGKMTEEEKEFATQNHNLIYKYITMKWPGLDVSDIYTVVVEAYMYAVREYLARDDLKKYTFGCIAFQAMKGAMYKHYKSKKNKTPDGIVSLSDIIPDTGKVCWEEVVDDGYTMEEDSIANILYQKIISQLNEKDAIAFNMLIQGSTLREIAAVIGCTHQNVQYIKNRIKKVATAYI